MANRFDNKYLVSSNAKSSLELLHTTFSGSLDISYFKIISYIG